MQYARQPLNLESGVQGTMKLGVMQPYFFPYIGYFSLLHYTDKWIVADDCQYIERGWINRNRIIKPSESDSMYIIVPVLKHSHLTIINDIQIDQSKPYVEKILKQLRYSYKKHSPYYNEVFSLVEECLRSETESISRLNILALKKVCDYIGISTDIQIFSKMGIDIGEINAHDDGALNISKALGAKEYINPPGGLSFYSKEKYEKAGIKLSFLKTEPLPYDQNKSRFLPNLSIIDVMMFNSREDIMRMLDSYTIL